MAPDSPDQANTPAADGHGTHETISIQGEGDVAPLQPSGFRFGRMFPATGYQPLILKLETCRLVGQHMTSISATGRGDSQLPAGYTYFGQFVDHDISMDGTEDAGRDVEDPTTPEVEQTPLKDLVQARSPSLDLDSLYGAPESRNDGFFDGAKFKLGQTTAVGGQGHSDKALPYDLPRKLGTNGGSSARPADIGDPRNDENLAVAQIHLLWLRFHNHVVDALGAERPGKSTSLLFEEARDLVTRHYQHIVLHDFVKRYIDAEVFDDVVVKGNRKLLPQCAAEVAFMPLEFSVAAYRHGHSQVRDRYDWNVNFTDTSFDQLFRFSAVSGDFAGLPTLPSNWIADFRRLFDFGSETFPHLAGGQAGGLNMAKSLDPFLAAPLGDLPEIRPLVQMGLRPFSNLAGLNLRRGSMRGLPSGQDVVKQLKKVKALTGAEMRSVIDDDFAETMRQTGLFDRTPLWLYVLLEAAVVGGGERLGKLGSIITAETFMSLVVTSRISILAPGAAWHPDDAKAQLGGNALTSMADILRWIDKSEPIIDPLQDDRLA